jgi:SAM-dependent methyltransferase
MKDVFLKYSEYYDLLYSDKNYQKEVNYIHDIIQKEFPNAKTILDLGCGTGVHANLLAEKGYHVTGVDLSDKMISIANNSLNNKYKINRDKLKFEVGDIRKIQLDIKFDVVISLFHVFSYLNSNKDVAEGMQAIKYHLNPNGISLFDFWYGPGVLTNLPTNRVKRLENNEIKLLRIAEPKHYPNDNVVEVNFELFIHDKNSSLDYSLTESHSMRYFFKPELEHFLSLIGIKNYKFYKWLEFDQPSIDTWNAMILINNNS